MAFVNSTISVPSGTQSIRIVTNTDFGLFNISLSADVDDLSCSFDCDKTSSVQFINYTSFAQGCKNIWNTNCIFYDTENISNIDTSINVLQELFATFDSIYQSECNTSSDYNMVFDIGYPLNAVTSVVNSHENASICCRAADSCAYTKSLYSNLGNILCTGLFSCGESYIWTSDYIDSTIEKNNEASVTIYCMAKLACSSSTLKSADKIICGAYLACNFVEIVSGQTLYCTYQACNNALITKVQTIYLIGQQEQIEIYSGNIGRMDVFLEQADAGTDLTLICNEGDECVINCGANACDTKTTLLTCYGKCFVNCNGSNGNTGTECVNVDLSMSPTATPSSAPTNAPSVPPTHTPSAAPTFNPSQHPTVPPTIYTGLTTNDVSRWFNYVLFVVLITMFLVVGFGYIDSQYIRKNELFRWNSIIMFGFYSIDFVSDIFFSIDLFLYMQNENEGESFYKYKTIYTILFISSIIFVFFPLIANLIQLHKELTKWLMDPILAQTEAPLWIISYLRFLYLVAVICGSSFSAITLVNSNLFQWSMFSMGLSKFHRKSFRNKRFFSVVLFENIPQLIIQIIAIILLIINTQDYSNLLLISVSMVFTISSILISVFEYLLSNKFIYVSSSIIVSFIIESKDIVSMPYDEYTKQIVFRQWKLIGAIGRILKLQSEQVERLKPKLLINGAAFTFLIAVNVDSGSNSINSFQTDIIKSSMKAAILNGELKKEFNNIYKINVTQINALQVHKLQDLLKLFTNINMTTLTTRDSVEMQKFAVVKKSFIESMTNAVHNDDGETPMVLDSYYVSLDDDDDNK